MFQFSEFLSAVVDTKSELFVQALLYVYWFFVIKHL